MPMFEPMLESARVQSALNVRTWADTPKAIQDAGYMICPADLPARVSGAAVCLGDDRLIVVNRCQSAERQRFTAVHELAHHAMHFGPSADASAPALTPAMKEFQADLFATSWVDRTASGSERTAVLEENPESKMLGSVLFAAAIVFAVALVIDLLMPPATTPASAA